MAGPKTGFVVPVRTAEITFQGTDYDGAVVECLLDVSLDWFFEVQRAVSGGDTEENEKMITAWADLCLIAWNLTEEDGTPHPVRHGTFPGSAERVYNDDYAGVAKGGGCTGRPFIADIDKWRFVGGG